MNPFRFAALWITTIFTGLVFAGDLCAQGDRADASSPVTTTSKAKKPDIAGKWVSESPLDSFVDDDSPQPVNTFLIVRSKDVEFKARYLGSRATSVPLNWSDEAHHFEGSKDSKLGKVTFTVTPTEDPDVLTCEIEAEYNIKSDAFYHKDVWRRVRNDVQTPKFLESPDIILTETSEGLVAYNKLNGTWAKIEINLPKDETTRLAHSVVSPGFASALISGELLGYCNRISKWSKLPISIEHQATAKVNHTQAALMASIGDKLYVLSAATGEWETPETVQGVVKRPASEVAASDTEAWRAAERYRKARDKTNPTDPSALEAKRELEKVVKQSLESQLKADQQQIADLKERLEQLEKQTEQRIANRSSILVRNVDELIASVDRVAKEIGAAEGKPRSPANARPTAILQYDDQADLTPQVKKETETVLVPYVARLKELGFELQSGQVTLRVQSGMDNAHYYPNNLSIVMDTKVVGDQSVLRREYNHHALSVALGADSQEIFKKCSGIESALADYFGCSACDDPKVGTEFAKALGYNAPYLRTMENQRRFT